MKIEWVVIETLAVLIENTAFLYFLSKRLQSKYTSMLPEVIAWLTLVAWGLTATFGELPLYDLVGFGIAFVYLLIVKKCTILQKGIAIMFAWAVVIGSSIAGAGLASSLTNATVEHSLNYQNFSRLLSIILIKMIQIVAFYILAQKHWDGRSLQRKPTLILGLAVFVNFFCVLIIMSNISEFNEQHNHLLLLLSIGLMFILIMIFIMFGLFIHEEKNSIELSAKLQRKELESRFFKEIDTMYADMRTWRHDYINNLTALRALAENGNADKIMAYIDNISDEPERNLVTLQTGNLVLDAVVSSKLWLARARDIEVSIQAVYPANNRIEDNDLCAITGNLLDNAIEACDRMTGTDVKKYIDFSLLVKGKNLILSISNSYNDYLKREGGRFLSYKRGRYHGIGLEHVDSIVSKYQGHITRVAEQGVFETHVMLPLLPPDGNS